MTGKLDTGTVLRAMFAGSVAVWSKGAAILKVRFETRRYETSSFSPLGKRNRHHGNPC
jgi:hypothetical protein